MFAEYDPSVAKTRKISCELEEEEEDEDDADVSAGGESRISASKEKSLLGCSMICV